MGAIGIFDSGYGGLTILKSIIQELPEYDYIYLGDNARTPYGTRSFDVVYEYTLEAVKKLFELDCELIILACNTASAKALRTIQKKDLPFLAPKKRILGVIRPTVEALSKYTRNNHIGVLATPGTIKSKSYILEIDKLYDGKNLSVSQHSCPMWVPLVENNEINNEGAKFFITKDLDNLLIKDKDIDTVLLACTHYPLLINQIKENLPKDVLIIEQGEIVAKSLKDYLSRHTEIDELCNKEGSRKFYTTEVASDFEKIASRFLNQKLEAEHIQL